MAFHIINLKHVRTFNTIRENDQGDERDGYNMSAFHYRFTSCILRLLMCQTLNILGLQRNEIVEVPEVLFTFHFKPSDICLQ